MQTIQPKITATYSALGADYIHSRTWGKLSDAASSDGVTAYLALTDYPTINLVILLYGDILQGLLNQRQHLRSIAAAMYRTLAYRQELRHALEFAQFDVAVDLIISDEVFADFLPTLRKKVHMNAAAISKGEFHAGY